ncbi:hypothetical protein D9M69_590210 [compost metagenome]
MTTLRSPSNCSIASSEALLLDAELSAPGFDATSASSSFTLFAGRLAGTTRNIENCPAELIGVKALNGS